MLVVKIDLVIPSLKNKFFDLRDSLPGDAYNWSWVRPLSDVKYLVLHHTATDESATPKEIANYHINHNGWGGIGYHFLVDKEGGIFYVGDISTARANVSDMNEQVIGIGLIGNFTQGRVPTSSQQDSTRKLCEFFLTNYPDLTIKGHKELPNQKTICPGDSWLKWKPVPDTKTDTLKSQVDNLQTSLALLHQQRISLQETLQERERQILALKGTEEKADNTLTIVGALIKLYQLILPRRVETFG